MGLGWRGPPACSSLVWVLRLRRRLRGRCLPICSRGVGPITWWRAGRLPGRWHPRRGRRGGRRLWLRRWRSPCRLRPLTRKRGTPKGGSPHPGSLVGAGVAEVPDHIVIDSPGHRAPQYVTAKANLLKVSSAFFCSSGEWVCHLSGCHLRHLRR